MKFFLKFSIEVTISLLNAAHGRIRPPKGGIGKRGIPGDLPAAERSTK